MRGLAVIEENYAYDFGLRLRAAREAKGLNQIQAAKLLNVHKNTLSLWETGSRKPVAETIKVICEVYRISADYLIGTDNRNPIYIDDLPERKQKIVLDLIESLRDD